MNNELLLIIQKIIDNLEKDHPEYLRPKAVVSVKFLKDVDKAWDAAGSADLAKFHMSDSDAIEIYRRLSVESIIRPMATETIYQICNIYNDIGLERFFTEDADSECIESWEFNNRANSRGHSGRPLEALKDHNRACEMAPACTMYLLNRASTFLELGMNKLALRDAMQAYQKFECKEFGSKDDFLSLDDIVMLASILNSCGRQDFAIKALLNFIAALNRYLPFLSKVDEDGFCSMALDGQSKRINITLFLNHAIAVFHSIRKTTNCNALTIAALANMFAELMGLINKMGYTNKLP